MKEAVSSAIHAAPDVDVEHLAELEHNLGAARLGQIVAEARRSFEAKLGALARAAARGDRDELGQLSHALVGSAGTVGLVATSRSALALEIACGRAGADLSEASACLIATLGRGLQELDAILRQRAALARPA